MIKLTSGSPRTAMSCSSLDRFDSQKYDYSKPVANPKFDVHIPHALVTFDKHCLNTHFYATQSKHAYWKKYRVNQPKRTYVVFPEIIKKIEYQQFLTNLKNPKCTSSTVHLSRYGDKTA